MAVLFLLLLFFFFFFLPILSFSNSCPTIHRFCDSDIDIQYPFYTNNNSLLMPAGCNGTYLIHCNASSSNSTPTIQLQDYLQRTLDYSVKQISYADKTITLGYPHFTNPYHCSFLYEFAHPIPHFDIPHAPIINPYDTTISSCKWGRGDFSLLSTNYKISVCKEFSFYYWNELEEDQDLLLQGVSPACRARQAPLFELALSFREPDDGLSLMSAGFSHYLELHPDCFSENLCSISKDSRIPKIIGSTVGSVGFISIIFLLVYVLHFKICDSKKKKILSTEKNIEAVLEKYGSLAPKRYMYSDVKKITKSFRNKIGQGGYGSVFEGSLDDGRRVAVKVLTNSKGNGDEFVNEIVSIGRSSHVNIVNLLGFCSEGSKKALIYEYMCNGSLDKLIDSEEPKATWEKLYQIAIGIARGLEYLHRGSNTRIVHFDIKPHNILLDEDFRPKISDFGLAKLCLRKDSILSMQGFRGTIGYIAPEVFSRHFGVVSSKSDIYSYGMMVLEMAGGRMDKHGDAQDTSKNSSFPHWIYKQYLQDNDDLQAYGVMAEAEEMARKMILIGLWCVQTLPQNRPSITRVIEMLEGSIDDLQVPPEPYLSSPPPPPPPPDPPLGAPEVTSSVDDSGTSNC